MKRFQEKLYTVHFLRSFQSAVPCAVFVFIIYTAIMLHKLALGSRDHLPNR